MSIRELEKHYRPRISSDARGYEILDWESEEAHLGRFRVLAEQLDLTGKTLLDVGCGVGDLYGFLHARGITLSYTGVDILPAMVAEARRRHPSGRFVCHDIFADRSYPDTGFDIIYSSGIFNLNLGNNRQFLRSALPVFFSLAREYVVFNLLDPNHPVQSERYAYFEPEEVLSWVEEYSDQISLFREYVPHDFTLVCRVT